MVNKLCILVCEHFEREAAAVVAAEQFDDVTVAAFPVRCGRPQIEWDELAPIVRACGERQQIHVIGSCCIAGLGAPPPGLEHCHLYKMEQCFHLLAGRNVVDGYLAADAYLLTPGWLAHWRQKMDEWGFDRKTAPEFFAEFSTRLLLLDTGVDANSPQHLREFAEFVARPFETAPVGLDFIRLLLTKIVLEWRLERERNESATVLNEAQQRIADYAMSLDLLGRLPRTMTEAQVVESMLELCAMLFAPGKLCYLPLENEKPGEARSSLPLPDGAAVKDRLASFRQEYGWTESGTGFLLRIGHRDQAMGVLEVDEVAFPEHKERYLNLALTVAGVCGLAIDNARAYQQIRQAGAERERLLIAEREQRLLADTLREMTLAITSQTSHAAVLDEVLRQARRIVPHNTANIALLRDDPLTNSGHRVLRIVCWQGYGDSSWEEWAAGLTQPLPDWSLDAQVIRSRQPLVISDTSQEPRWLALDETAWIKSYLAVPLCLHDRVLGLLKLDGATPNEFSAEDAQRLLPLASAAAIAIENTQLVEQGCSVLPHANVVQDVAEIHAVVEQL